MTTVMEMHFFCIHRCAGSTTIYVLNNKKKHVNINIRHIINIIVFYRKLTEVLRQIRILFETA